jgi:antitoxin component YwqK of YwqJK toxin-antitoxin module
MSPPGTDRRVALAALAVALLCAAGVWVVTSTADDPAGESGAPAPEPAPASVDDSDHAPRRTRVDVNRGAQEKASAEAERSLAELDELRRALRAQQPRVRREIEEPAPEDGLVVTQHPDGTEFRRGWMRDGKRDGFWIERFESGARVETYYRMGVRHGQEAAWHPDGTPRFLGEYDEGEMSGTWTAWHANGNVLSARRYARGKLHGPLETFHANGMLAEESHFVEGAEHGLNRGWHATGHLAWEIVYVEGERHGRATWWDDQGRRKAEGTYERGKLHGRYVEYAPDGSVKGTEQWEHGHRVAMSVGRAGREDE